MPVYLRIIIDAVRVELSAQMGCEPVRWNAHAPRVNRNKEEVRILNAYLDSLQAKVYEVHCILIDKNEPVTVANINEILRGTTEKPRLVLELFQHNNDLPNSLARNIHR